MGLTSLVMNIGKRVATELKDLPPLKAGFVRVVHRTNPKNMNSIVEKGLWAKNKGLCWTSDTYTEDEFWKMLSKDYRGDAFGTGKIIMDIPQEEYNILTRSSNRGFYDFDKNNSELPLLVCPSKYIVGAIEQKYPWSDKCINIFKHLSKKNPERNVEKTDLSRFNNFEIEDTLAITKQTEKIPPKGDIDSWDWD
ncbi:hypothetical protein J6I39_09620 [bacterium]|nr:hypothetical protein [bacterium]